MSHMQTDMPFVWAPCVQQMELKLYNHSNKPMRPGSVEILEYKIERMAH